MPQHRKVSPLSDASFRLHVTAMAWCAEELTDGAVPGDVPSTLTAAPRGKRLVAALDELVSKGLWERTDHGYVIHDFLDWNPSGESVRAKRAAAKERMTTLRSVGVRANTAETNREVREPFAPSVSVSVSVSEKEDPPTPFRIVTETDQQKPKRKDPMAYLTHGHARDRPDVKRVHEVYKRVFGMPGHSFIRSNDIEAETLAEAIDQHGEDVCIMVLEYAPRDGKVSGRTDENKEKHESIRYIFGNSTTFGRLHRDATKEKQAETGLSVSAEMKRREAL